MRKWFKMIHCIDEICSNIVRDAGAEILPAMVRHTLFIGR
jgi:hypothetical protein